MLSVKPVTAPMVAWSNALEVDPKFPIGSSATQDFGGVLVEARAETHTWWGAHPERPPAPHKGISLYYADHAQIPSTEPVYGIDISDFQPTIDWATVKKVGKTKYVISKATEGKTVTAKTFKAHWDGTKAAGLVRGAYHFFRTTSTPTDQIGHFFEVVGALGPRDLPPILDVEWQSSTKALNGVDKDVFAKMVMDCLKLMAAKTQKGKRPVIYTAPGFWSLMPAGFGDACAKLADLWLAHYGVKTTQSLVGWPRWAFWQYAADENEQGVTTRGDANVFCGGAVDFEHYLDTGVLPMLDPTTPMGLQVALNLLGASPPLVEDGVAGPKTKAALVRFQIAWGLERSGVTDPATVAKIQELMLANDSVRRLGGVPVTDLPPVLRG
jgi:lysozyme